MIETVTKDLKPLLVRGKPASVLVTGATGYIGGRLVRELLHHNYRVRVLVRDKLRIQDHSWANQVDVVEGDVFDLDSLEKALDGIHVAY